MTGSEASACVTDVVHIMPGKLFARFAAVASECFDFQSRGGMFSSRSAPDNGHSCYPAMVREFGQSKVKLITEAWIQDYVDSIVSICNGCAREQNAFTCNGHHQHLWTCRL